MRIELNTDQEHIYMLTPTIMLALDHVEVWLSIMFLRYEVSLHWFRKGQS